MHPSKQWQYFFFFLIDEDQYIDQKKRVYRAYTREAPRVYTNSGNDHSYLNKNHIKMFLTLLNIINYIQMLITDI